MKILWILLSLILLFIFCEQTTPLVGVFADRETIPVTSRGDAADDPAIWVDTDDPGRSAIIATNKDSYEGGLIVYSLEGNRIASVEDPGVNNVDIREGFSLGRGKTIVLVAASRRKDNSIALYRFDTGSRTLEDIEARRIYTHPAYGSCLFHDIKKNRYFYFVTSKEGPVQQWELFAARGGKVDARLVRTLKLQSVCEGCVADDRRGYVYIAEENRGIWRFDASPGSSDSGILVDSIAPGRPLASDIEGLALYLPDSTSGYLIASLQALSRFALYDIDTHEFLGEFIIADGPHTDGVSRTDGIEVTARSLGPLYPMGLFVAQDDNNAPGNQNFKFVNWQRVHETFGFEDR